MWLIAMIMIFAVSNLDEPVKRLINWLLNLAVAVADICPDISSSSLIDAGNIEATESTIIIVGASSLTGLPLASTLPVSYEYLSTLSLDVLIL